MVKPLASTVLFKSQEEGLGLRSQAGPTPSERNVGLLEIEARERAEDRKNKRTIRRNLVVIAIIAITAYYLGENGKRSIEDSYAVSTQTSVGGER
jgi:hypothetical protein